MSVKTILKVADIRMQRNIYGIFMSSDGKSQIANFCFKVKKLRNSSIWVGIILRHAVNFLVLQRVRDTCLIFQYQDLIVQYQPCHPIPNWADC